MKRIAIWFVIVMLLMLGTIVLYGGDNDMSSIFPELEGWTKKGAPDVYNPENLFEYINGAAEVFLSYDFRQLASLSYENDQKHSFTVDVYMHGSDRNGFGIYSAEKPLEGEFVSFGAQGYYEKGILNFLKGKYYVKMSGYDLGDNDKQVLTTAAGAIAKRLDGNGGFPAVVSCFPQKGKKSNSERFINENFMGHSFLHSAFVAEYVINGQDSRVFIIEGEDKKGVEDVLQKYLDFVKKKGKTIDGDAGKGFYRFQDPYYRSAGTMNLKVSKNYIWGLLSKDNTAADFFIAEIEKKLKEKKLI